ncbi:unnamed protein product [Fusarium graminearum]|uniref:Chromosome 2, complete genome n=2 Tax=Gibberella zeae TaxID=5518 RepID=I1RHQ1_GIBZE|nr:hypothetical protein FGSG_03312 [Fusarium graminearum PH-1]AVA07422.1 PR-1-like protein PR-1L-4 [Fusarium graminearum]AVA07426.1 PR-1-like protein PR-1L-4 [Fusarium graminearum]ESU09929.1 hypothetical protein FGSG_03312 [Fusarium graminearum PH-1]EYB32565.1 hypothetical protein FG05_03312 [Fusarium graminearum]PCD27193.1 hypothetical protein FGRA07_02332 [Fusarium graminearum]|eukprot:XP_011322428.1 hypothetical protein FGSG_03312 [Fusarium graminearum PH-1]
MHFSAFLASVMATSAMASPHYKVVTEYAYVTKVVTAGAEQPKPTYVVEQPAPVEAKPTTLRWVKKPRQSHIPAPQPTYVPSPAPVEDEEPETKQPEKKEPDSGSSNGSLTADQQKAVDLHNEARKAVGNGPLEWDDSLVSGAQEWADHIASLGSLTHSQGKDGENLYMGTSSTPFADAIEAFLSEKSLYNGETISGSNYMSFGHYTQCVWKTTTKVGMAVAKGSDGASYVVARYQEPGNMIGSKPY